MWLMMHADHHYMVQEEGKKLEIKEKGVKQEQGHA